MSPETRPIPEKQRLYSWVHVSRLLSFPFSFQVITDSRSRKGVLIIEANKIRQGPGSHFHSVHGYLGVITSFVLLVQYVFGFLMWGVPGVFGGIDNAKALWKYHRMSGYLLYLLVLATVISAVYTDFNVNVLNIQLWTVIVAVTLVVIGVYPRLHPRKFGFDIGRGR